MKFHSHVQRRKIESGCRGYMQFDKKLNESKKKEQKIVFIIRKKEFRKTEHLNRIHHINDSTAMQCKEKPSF